MKAFLIYWTIGCAVVGFPMGLIITECPAAKIETVDIVGLVVTWPTLIFAAVVRTGQPPLPKAKCGVPL